MITTLEQLILNHYAISKDGKLFTETQVRLAFELGQYDPKKKKRKGCQVGDLPR